MNCNVIQDLMILYTDGCCSDESKAMVEEHIKGCKSCQDAFEEMSAPLVSEKQAKASKATFTPINSWKASVLQSVLLFVSFALIIFGVAREAGTPSGATNGLWAMAVIIPATGFLLSLANWYFVRVYPGRKVFSTCSLLAAAAFMLIGFAWSALHYRGAWANFFNGSALSVALLIAGCVLCAALLIGSKLLSDRYAKLLGKE